MEHRAIAPSVLEDDGGIADAVDASHASLPFTSNGVVRHVEGEKRFDVGLSRPGERKRAKLDGGVRARANRKHLAHHSVHVVQ